MRTLYHLWLDPFSRKVRVTMAEKGLDVLLTIESVWEKREKFLELNTAPNCFSGSVTRRKSRVERLLSPIIVI